MNLQSLWLNGNKVTDVGLKHIKKFAQLKSLALSGSKVTDAGYERLKEALPNCYIEYSGIILDPEDEFDSGG